MNQLYNYINNNLIIDLNDLNIIEDILYESNIPLDFLDNKINKDITEIKFNLINYNKLINNIKLNLNIYNPRINKYDYDLYHDLLTIIYKMIGLCKNSSIKKLDITIFLLYNNKMIKDDTTIIGIREVNSGCSIINNKYNKIYIWRHEEVNKVLIHELIHSLDLDPVIGNDSSNYYLLSSYFSYCPNKINLFEAYVEYLATILNILFFMSKNNIKFIEFNQYIKTEITFGYKQFSKILQFNGIYNFEEFYIKNSLNIKCKFKEKTSVFMYYFCKLILLINYKKISHLSKNYSEDYIININKSYKFTNKLYNIMIFSINKNIIDNFNYYLSLNYDKSLRMCYYN